jgi:uncharacterized membrane protein YfcA
MEIYLPIAEIPMNIFWLLLAGFFAGILSGLFGIGGGFIMTPLLIFMGVTPAIAVASSANQIIASSFSGFLTHARRKNVDFKMGNILILGGFVGSSIGVMIFKFLKVFGQIDLVISLLYIFILGFIGMSMAIESSNAILKVKAKSMKVNKREKLFNKLPFKVDFPRSDLKISILVPIIVSVFSGVLVSIMGIGGGFIMIPAMIYILGMPTSVVVGTSLFQVIFVTSNVTILHVLTTQSVDIVLAGVLLISSVIGAQFGTRIALFCPAEKLRAVLAFIILVLVFKLALSFFIAPLNPFEVMLLDEN